MVQFFDSQCINHLTFTFTFTVLVCTGCLDVQYAQQPQQPVMVIQTQAPMVFPPDPIQTTCPHCHEPVTTMTEPVNGLLTWLSVGGCCLFGSVAQKHHKHTNYFQHYLFYIV